MDDASGPFEDQTRVSTKIGLSPARNDESIIGIIDDDRIEIDSSVIEWSIRPIALIRKNALFAGSDEGTLYCSPADSLINQELFGVGRKDTGRRDRIARAIHDGSERQAVSVVLMAPSNRTG